MWKQTVILFSILILSSSCVGTTNKAQTGGLGGAAGGALIGQIIGRDTKSTLLGAGIGGLLGYMIGNEMDKTDQQKVSNVYEYERDNNTTRWENPNSGNSYAMTPTRTYRDQNNNRDCRDAEILATIDGKAEKTVATACRENGQWVIQQ